MHVAPRKTASRTGLVIVVACLAGCGGDGKLGTVHGTVTLQEQPLAAATVTFHPVHGGRPSIGVTDENGRYSLKHSRKQNGALLGMHKVTITTLQEPDSGGENEAQRKGRTEELPDKYHRDTILTAHVNPGSNTIDFPLDRKSVAGKKARGEARESRTQRQQTLDCE